MVTHFWRCNEYLDFTKSQLSDMCTVRVYGIYLLILYVRKFPADFILLSLKREILSDASEFTASKRQCHSILLLSKYATEMPGCACHLISMK